MTQLLTDKVALVTGGSRGIGRSICVELAREGAKVIVNYAGSQAAAEETLAQIKALGGDGILVQGDVSKTEDAEKLVEAAVGAFGRLDILVNNAGITRDNLLIRMKEEDWDAVLNTNLKGVFLCTKAAAKVMMKQRYGRIVNIASVVGLFGNAGQANYCSAKAGVIGLTKSNARELSTRGITVNAVAPGYIDTEMTVDLSEEVRTKLLANIPLDRMGRPEEIAHAVTYLASDRAAFITGHVLAVDGGMSM